MLTETKVCCTIEPDAKKDIMNGKALKQGQKRSSSIQFREPYIEYDALLNANRCFVTVNQ